MFWVKLNSQSGKCLKSEQSESIYQLNVVNMNLKSEQNGSDFSKGISVDAQVSLQMLRRER